MLSNANLENEQRRLQNLDADKIQFEFVEMQSAIDLQRLKDDAREDRILLVDMAPIVRKSLELTEYALKELYLHFSAKKYSLARIGQAGVLILPPCVRF